MQHQYTMYHVTKLLSNILLSYIVPLFEEPMASKNDSDQKAGSAVEFYRVMTDSFFLTNISDHAVRETLLLGVPTPGPGQA